MKRIQKTESEEIISRLNLKAHPEGGYSQLIYEDHLSLPEHSLPKGYVGSRSFSNAIYYLLPAGSKCILHRIRMLELWTFHLGGPLEVYDISPNGELKTTILGHDILNGNNLTYVFPNGHWIGAKPLKGSEFSLVSCVTSPGFTFSDWEKGERTDLINKFPHLEDIIKMTT